VITASGRSVSPRKPAKILGKPLQDIFRMGNITFLHALDGLDASTNAIGALDALVLVLEKIKEILV
jgi:hypothetical protein